MAGFSTNVAIDMSDWTFHAFRSVDPVRISSDYTTITVLLAGGRKTIIRGEGFIEDGNGDLAGVVYTINHYAGDAEQYRFNALGASPGTLLEYLETRNDALVGYLVNRGDFIHGSRFADVLKGFDKNDYLDGRGGRDMIYGNAGNDLLTWRGGDTFFGGEGRDRLQFTGGDVNLRNIDQNRIRGVESLDTRFNDRTITLDKSDVLDMSPEGVLRIFGDTGDVVNIVGHFRVGEAQGDFAVYHLAGGAVLMADSDILVQ